MKKQPLTPEQKQALQFLLSILQPPTITQLANQGSRQSWAQIIQAASVLEPLTAEP